MAQLIAPLYCPGTEFMKRVFITSTGDAMMVVQKPAAKAAVKWQGMLSVENKEGRVEKPGTITRWHEVPEIPGDQFEMFALACHQVVRQDELFDDVICHQLTAVYNAITSYVWQTAWKTVQHCKQPEET